MTAKINPALLAQIAAGASLKTDTTVSDVCDIPLGHIIANPYQPRLIEDNIEELSESIRLHGLLQPVAVVRNGLGYQLISGHRRLAAHRHLGRDTIRANIIDADDDDLAMLALIENIHRSDLHPLEIALSLVHEPFISMPDHQLAPLLGYSITKLRNTRAILRLENLVLEHLNATRPAIGVDILVEIQKLPDVEQFIIYDGYLNGTQDRKSIRALVRAYNGRETLKDLSPISRLGSTYKIDCSAVSDTNMVNFEEELKQLLEKYTKETK
jgi:ParB/RepB/Spo0J family partition protein